MVIRPLSRVSLCGTKQNYKNRNAQSTLATQGYNVTVILFHRHMLKQILANIILCENYCKLAYNVFFFLILTLGIYQTVQIT